jgi:hypothetical protein
MVKPWNPESHAISQCPGAFERSVEKSNVAQKNPGPFAAPEIC